MHVAFWVKGTWKPSSTALSTLSYSSHSRVARLHTAVRPLLSSLESTRSLRAQFRLQTSLLAPSLTTRSAHTVVAEVASAAMERNGELRNKRKMSPVAALERPTKQLKHELSSLVDGDESPHNGGLRYALDSDGEGSPTIPLAAATADSPEWQATIERVVRNVVSIHFSQTCSFDTDAATSSEATGFVVDAERGYVLTNRHVVCAGPFWGYCIFDNHEEVGV